MCGQPRSGGGDKPCESIGSLGKGQKSIENTTRLDLLYSGCMVREWKKGVCALRSRLSGIRKKKECKDKVWHMTNEADGDVWLHGRDVRWVMVSCRSCQEVDMSAGELVQSP